MQLNYIYIIYMTNIFVFDRYEKDDETYSVALNLFGFVVPKETQHYIRGLNICVKLKKLVCTEDWPRLTKLAEHPRNVTWRFDENKVKADNMCKSPFYIMYRSINWYT